MIQDTQNNISKKINSFGENNIPFIFIIDYEMKSPMIFPISSLCNENIFFDINGFKNYLYNSKSSDSLILEKFPIPFDAYRKSFSIIQDHLLKGNSYLVNLTFPTQIRINLTIEEIFHIARSKYKLLMKNHFVVFSPEPFVKIIDGKIYSFPMKGTIDAKQMNAANHLLNDEKEIAEHITIVDLIRNDLNMVSRNVRVEKFRYIEKIISNDKEILQTSSMISGCLDKDYVKHIGDILFSLLPAGSVTGSPKKMTVEIIKEAETYDRGFYTGVFGYFDGINLDSAVMIRFIENINGELFYKSGGGITVYSDINAEYKELQDKIYVPIK